MEVKGNEPICYPSRDLSKDYVERPAVVGFAPVQELMDIGPGQFPLAPDLRDRLLRHRDDGRRRGPF